MLFNKFKKDVEDDCTEVHKSITYTILNEFMSEKRDVNIKQYLEANISRIRSLTTMDNNCEHDYSRKIYDCIINSGFNKHNDLDLTLSLSLVPENSAYSKVTTLFIGYFMQELNNLDNNHVSDILSCFNYPNISKILNNDMNHLFNGAENYNLLFKILDYYLNQKEVFKNNIFTIQGLHNIDNVSPKIINRITEWYLPLTTGYFKDVNTHMIILNNLIYISDKYYKKMFTPENNTLKIPHEIIVYKNIMVDSCIKYNRTNNIINHKKDSNPLLFFHDFIINYEKDKHFVNIELYANTYNFEYNDYSEIKDQYESFKNVINNIGISALGLL